MKKVLYLVSVVFSAPVVALAAGGTTVWGLIGMVDGFLRILTPMLLGLSVLWFMYIVLMYTIAGDDKKRDEAKKRIPTALVGLFVMVSFWGILSVVTNTTKIGPEQLRKTDIPCIPNEALGVSC